LSGEVIAGTLGEAAATCWAEVLADESAAFENMVIALEKWSLHLKWLTLTLHQWVNHLRCSEKRARLW
jgi:hypothetical protein